MPLLGSTARWQFCSINLLMILAAWLLLDKRLLKYIVYSSFLLPLLMYITPSQKIIEDDLLAVIVGGAVFCDQGSCTLSDPTPLVAGQLFHRWVFKNISILILLFRFLALGMLVTFLYIFVFWFECLFHGFIFIGYHFDRHAAIPGRLALDHKYQIRY